jgi:hypothetical protein
MYIPWFAARNAVTSDESIDRSFSIYLSANFFTSLFLRIIHKYLLHAETMLGELTNLRPIIVDDTAISNFSVATNSW